MLPSFPELTKDFARIGLLSFGGPAAQIALMHKVLVEERRWLSEQQFLSALSFCMLLPGPEAMQLATYAGWKLHGLRGGLIAGLLFVLPGALVIFALALLYVLYSDLPLIDTLFLGVQAAAVVIVVEALIKVSRRALNGTAQWVLAGLAFMGIFVFALPFPLIIALAAAYGIATATASDPPKSAQTKTNILPILTFGLVLWASPVALNAALGGPPILTEIGLFFSKLAVVTFGGAYAVLAYMAQDVVTQQGWLTATQMMDGLGLAETTPGPLILVTQFVAFLAGAQEGGPPLAFAAALMALWVTFTPCFIWIFAGAPFIERIASMPRLKTGLEAVTAAVVGVILNLSLWFALHVIFAEVTQVALGPARLWLPNPASARWQTLALIALAALLLLRLHWGIGRTLALTALAALGLSLI